MTNYIHKQPILVIDDDRKLCELIMQYLEPMGYAVDLRHTGRDGLLAAKENNYDAVLLDVMMPEIDGFEVLKELRKTSNVPVLMLTALGEEADRIVGLEMGADDYMPKTFSTRELLARLRAVIRRSHLTEKSEAPTEDKEYIWGELSLNESTHTVLMAGEPLVLTALEFAILTSMMRSRGRVKSREQLIDEVCERKFDVYDRSIDVHMSALRKKLGDDAKNPRFIRTVRGVGYQLIEPESNHYHSASL